MAAHAAVATAYAERLCSSRHGALLRRRAVVVGWLLAATITASGIGYVLLSTTLTPAAFLSRSPLRVWIAGLAVASWHDAPYGTPAERAALALDLASR
ncbi:hypothetical protein ACF07V_37535 [Streptomyces sp. NPDC015661]|uniref:hypothetical protein n=1 Tax=Streptomyces sp. NPDC015661 TaxID=3364961 RepID=UPI0036F9B6F3